jgi:hypothetical protein
MAFDLDLKCELCERSVSRRAKPKPRRRPPTLAPRRAFPADSPRGERAGVRGGDGEVLRRIMGASRFGLADAAASSSSQCIHQVP